MGGRSPMNLALPLAAYHWQKQTNLIQKK